VVLEQEHEPRHEPTVVKPAAAGAAENGEGDERAATGDVPVNGTTKPPRTQE